MPTVRYLIVNNDPAVYNDADVLAAAESWHPGGVFLTDDSNTASLQDLIDAGSLLPLDTTPTPATVFTVGTENESTETVNVAVQLRDDGNIALTAKTLARVWLSDAAGGAQCSVPPSGTVIIGTNGVIIDILTAKTSFSIITNATGQFDLNIIESAAKTLYVNVEYRGEVFSSPAVVWTA